MRGFFQNGLAVKIIVFVCILGSGLSLSCAGRWRGRPANNKGSAIEWNPRAQISTYQNPFDLMQLAGDCNPKYLGDLCSQSYNILLLFRENPYSSSGVFDLIHNCVFTFIARNMIHHISDNDLENAILKIQEGILSNISVDFNGNPSISNPNSQFQNEMQYKYWPEVLETNGRFPSSMIHQALYLAAVSCYLRKNSMESKFYSDNKVSNMVDLVAKSCSKCNYSPLSFTQVCHSLGYNVSGWRELDGKGNEEESSDEDANEKRSWLSPFKSTIANCCLLVAGIFGIWKAGKFAIKYAEKQKWISKDDAESVSGKAKESPKSATTEATTTEATAT